jgi:hypothetical protein
MHTHQSQSPSRSHKISSRPRSHKISSRPRSHKVGIVDRNSCTLSSRPNSRQHPLGRLCQQQELTGNPVNMLVRGVCPKDKPYLTLNAKNDFCCSKNATKACGRSQSHYVKAEANLVEYRKSTKPTNYFVGGEDFHPPPKLAMVLTLRSKSMPYRIVTAATFRKAGKRFVRVHYETNTELMIDILKEWDIVKVEEQ